MVIPLRNKIQFILDRSLFKGTPNEIAIENKQLRQEIAQTEKYKSLSTLTTGIAHEVKNPLTAIKTFSEYLPEKLNDKEFLNKFANIVGKEVDRIDEMIHQLLDYGKPAPLSIKETNIHKLINDTTDILSSKFIHQKINVVKDFEADEHLILNVDPNQLRQALLNILLNALEAMPEGGKLIVETEVTGVKDYRIKGSEDLRKTGSEDQRIKGSKDQAPNPIPLNPKPFNSQILKSSNPKPLNPRPSDSHFLITIQDTGHGMSPEELKQIFDPFFSKKDQGTGLGMSITQSLIENHGGTIEAKSAVGSGTEVTIRLPV